MEVDFDSSPEYEDIEETSSEAKKKKKKRKVFTEPQKPVSAYALFFRDTQAAIKAENSMATFGEISKIVASMWDSLMEEAKQVYKQKTEAAKREYLKKLAAYRASCSAKDEGEDDESTPLVFLKEKTVDKRTSPLMEQQLPPPPKLQMAPIVLSKEIRVQQQAAPKAASVPTSGSSSQNVDTVTTPPVEESPVQRFVLQPGSATTSPNNPPPIQLRNIVPKAQGSITILQSKPGQVIKLLPASQASNITNGNNGKSRIFKMSDLIRYEASAIVPEQIPARGEGEVQPILQTLAQETGDLDTSMDTETSNDDHRNGDRTNGIDVSTAQVISFNESDSKSDSDEQVANGPSPMEVDNSNYKTSSIRVCLRESCGNLAKSDPQWNNDYCCASCVVEHCRDVFDAWASVRRLNATAT